MSRLVRIDDHYIPDIYERVGYEYNSPFDEKVVCDLCGEDFYTDEFETVCPSCIAFTDYEDDYIKKIA